MSAPITIRIADLVGPIYVSTNDGQRVHDTIAPLVRSGRRVTLSFADITTVIAFLNGAVGQLYGEFTDAYLQDHLSVSDIDAHDTAILRRIVENAKTYFKASEQFDRAWTEETSDEA